jgi:hypothetical protein
MTSISSHSHRIHRTISRRFALATLIFATLLAGRSIAENPWNSCSAGWGSSDHGVASAGWAPWGATAGGTFDSPSYAHHRSLSAGIPAIPASHGTPTIHAIPAIPDEPRIVSRNGDIDPVMYKAASIAEQRALPHGILRCWHYVKEALVAAGSVSSYPQTVYAKDAGHELVERYGFVRLPVRSPERAPVGAVCVYSGCGGAGHVEIRTARGFASDYLCSRPAALPFLGAYTRLTPRHDTAQVGIPATPGS